jgi:hypothetical protein
MWFAYRGIIIFSALHAVAIISYGFIAVHRYNEELRTNFSTDERLSLNWLRYLLLLSKIWLANSAPTAPTSPTISTSNCTRPSMNM